MPINIRNSTGRRPIAELPAALLELWLKLRIRWRHNPGFVAAAAAGSIGLFLALVMAIQGGIRLLDDEAAVSGLPDEEGAYAALGEASGFEAESVLADPFAESGSRVRPGSRSRVHTSDTEPEASARGPGRGMRSRFRSADSREEPDDEDESDINPPQQDARDPYVRVRPAARKHLLDDDFEDTVTEEIGAEKPKHPLADDGQPLADDARGPHPLDEHPLAAEPTPPRRFPRRSVPVDDRSADEGPDADDPAGNRSSEDTAATPESADADRPTTERGPSLESGGLDDDSETEDETETIRPAANVVDAGPGGWKHQPHGAPEQAASPPALVQKSRSVETVIFATPERRAPARPAPLPEVQKPRLGIAISGPVGAAVGQSCKFEIRVTNTAATTARSLALSVELPDELVHPVGQSLEQHIEKLAPGEVYRALVRAQAKAPGKAVLKADVAADGEVVAQSSASAQIGATRTAVVNLSDCECLPLIQGR